MVEPSKVMKRLRCPRVRVKPLEAHRACDRASKAGVVKVIERVKGGVLGEGGMSSNVMKRLRCPRVRVRPLEAD